MIRARNLCGLSLALTACGLQHDPAEPTDVPGAEVVLQTGDSAVADTSEEPDTADSGEDTSEVVVDEDGDGWFTPEDCNDLDATVHPGGHDGYYEEDTIDQDCSGYEGPIDGILTACGDYGNYLTFQDLDGDGKEDILTIADYGSWDGSSTHLNLASALDPFDSLCSHPLASWSKGQVDAIVGDLDGDGIPEFAGISNFAYVSTEIVSVSNLVYSGAAVMAGGAFGDEDAIWELPFGDPAFWAVFPDVQGDGEPDVVFWPLESASDEPALSGYPLSSLDGVSGPGDPLWTIAGSGSGLHLQHTDLDGDGLADVLDKNDVFLGSTLSRGGVFTAADADIHYDFSAHEQIVFVADLDGDGGADVGVTGGQHPDGSPAAVVSGSGRGTLSAADGFVTLPDRAEAYVRAFGTVPDLNDDGRDELVVSWSGHEDAAESYLTTYPSATLSGSLPAEAESNRFWTVPTDLFYPGSDLLGDPTPELIFSAGSGVHVIDGTRLRP